MGVFLPALRGVLVTFRLPHARGGVSDDFGYFTHVNVSSPRTWGCFSRTCHARHSDGVFPTHVGVFLVDLYDFHEVERLPHARGGVSRFQKSSSALFPVFPTHVGVFPAFRFLAQPSDSLPHARGGVSRFKRGFVHCPSSSPRTWGCFCLEAVFWPHGNVFPTHVGVFLASPRHDLGHRGLPHARGGVSCVQTATAIVYKVFPTHVGVFLTGLLSPSRRLCLPHARGGVSPSRGCPPKAPSSRLGLFTSALDIDSFIWRE